MSPWTPFCSGLVEHGRKSNRAIDGASAGRKRVLYRDLTDEGGPAEAIVIQV